MVNSDGQHISELVVSKPRMRNLAFPVLILTLASLAGCASGPIRPLTSTPPAPYILVPNQFFVATDFDRAAKGNIATSERQVHLPATGRRFSHRSVRPRRAYL